MELADLCWVYCCIELMIRLFYFVRGATSVMKHHDNIIPHTVHQGKSHQELKEGRNQEKAGAGAEVMKEYHSTGLLILLSCSTQDH